MYGEMPLLDISKLELTDEERKIASLVVASQGKNKGRLRAAKPKIEYTVRECRGGRYRFSEYYSGCAAYVWRMVAFQVSPLGQHKCMPIMADCDLPGDSIMYGWDTPEGKTEREKTVELRKRMDVLAR